YSSQQFDDLAKENPREQVRFSEDELAAARALADRSTRTVALAVKASGGLLVNDLARHLPADEKTRAIEIQKVLQDQNLVSGELVVICKKTQTRALRVPGREVLGDLAMR